MRVLKNPRFYAILALGRILPDTLAFDRFYLQALFKAKMGKKLDLNNPQTFNEKLQWLKLYNRKREYTKLVDKYAVRQYIAETIGEEYLIPLVGGPWKSVEEIDFDELPDQFVLKCNHDCGSVIICRNKASFDIGYAKKMLAKAMRRNYYKGTREWPYKDVPPQIIAEKYMASCNASELTDYKIMCFNNIPRCIFTCTDRNMHNELKVTIFDLHWNRLPFERHYYPASNTPIPRPQNLDNMLKLSRILSENKPFTRIDFYEIEGKTYFGEITFYPGSGLEEFSPEEGDYTLGSWLELPHQTV